MPSVGLLLPRQYGLLVLGAAVVLAIRSVDLASVPEWFTDEGFWAMPPRDFVLFGRWTLGTYYHFYLSPLYSAVLAADFRMFGPGIVQARWLSVVLGLLTVVLTARLGTRLGDRRVGIFAAMAVAFDGPVILTNRSVILESLQAFLLVSLALASLGNGRSRRVGQAILLGLALLTKLLSAYAAPVIILHSWLTRGRREGLRDVVTLGIGFLLAGLVFGVLAVGDWGNFAHAWGAEFAVRGHGTPEGEGSLGLTISYYATRAPVLLSALALTTGWRVLRRRSLSDEELFVGLWLLVGIVSMGAQGYAPQRYFEPLIPFAWLWIFLVARDVAWPGGKGKAAISLAAGLLCVHALFNVTSFFGYYYVLGHRDANPVRTAQWIDENVSVDRRVLAPFRLVVSTKVPALGFESMPHQLSTAEVRALGIDYVVTSPDTRYGPPSFDLDFVESDQRDFGLVAKIGEISVYRVNR
jgi:4-amino-4-deoxy-L-arabinose transferase-like glycosyltransferase